MSFGADAKPDALIARDWNRSKPPCQEGSELVTFCPVEAPRRRRQTAPDRLRHRREPAAPGAIHPQPQGRAHQAVAGQVGYERMQEIADPTQALDRARQTWQLGRSDKWIQQHMTGQETRNKLTDYWAEHGIAPGQEFALLTNLIHQEWAGLSVAQHKARRA